MNISGMGSYSQAMSRLSSGQRINSAADDAAGLAISEHMRGQIRGDSMATRNMRDSQSMLQVAEGALGSTHSVLQRMRELSVQANNGLLTGSDRSAIQSEFDQLRETINYIGKNTEFNGKNLLDGSLSDMRTTTDGSSNSLGVSIGSALAGSLGDSETGMTLADVDLANDPGSALKVIDGAIEQISGSRSSIGATQNRLDFAVNVSETKQVNTQAAESRIRDADMAKEIMNMNRDNILQQTYFATQKMQMSMAGQMLSLLG